MDYIWSCETTLEFIELYKSEPVLWDPNHPSYKNRPCNNEAWDRIKDSISVDCSVHDLKRKKESLMTSFRNIMAKKRKAILSGEEIIKPSWFAFRAMESFLGSKYISEISYDNKAFIGSYENNVEYLEDGASDISDNPVEEINISSTLQPVTQQLHTNKRPASTILSGGNTEQDEIDLYTELLKKKLKKLPENERDTVMNKIDNLIYETKRLCDNHLYIKVNVDKEVIPSPKSDSEM